MFLECNITDTIKRKRVFRSFFRNNIWKLVQGQIRLSSLLSVAIDANRVSQGESFLKDLNLEELTLVNIVERNQ